MKDSKEKQAKKKCGVESCRPRPAISNSYLPEGRCSKMDNPRLPEKRMDRLFHCELHSRGRTQSSIAPSVVFCEYVNLLVVHRNRSRRYIRLKRQEFQASTNFYTWLITTKDFTTNQLTQMSIIPPPTRQEIRATTNPDSDDIG